MGAHLTQLLQILLQVSLEHLLRDAQDRQLLHGDPELVVEVDIWHFEYLVHVPLDVISRRCLTLYVFELGQSKLLDVFVLLHDLLSDLLIQEKL